MVEASPERRLSSQDPSAGRRCDDQAEVLDGGNFKLGLVDVGIELCLVESL